MGAHISKRSLLDFTDSELTELIRSAIVKDPYRSNPHEQLSDEEIFAQSVDYMASVGVRPISAKEYRAELMLVKSSTRPQKIALWKPLYAAPDDSMEVCGGKMHELETPTELIGTSTTTPGTPPPPPQQQPPRLLKQADGPGQGGHQDPHSVVEIQTPLTPKRGRICIEVVAKNDSDWQGLYVVQTATESNDNDNDTVFMALSEELTQEWAGVRK